MFNVRKMRLMEGKKFTIESEVATLLVQELFEMLPKRGQKEAKKRPKRGQKAAKRLRLNNFCNFRVVKMCSIANLFIHTRRPYFVGERKIISPLTIHIRNQTFLSRRCAAAYNFANMRPTKTSHQETFAQTLEEDIVLTSPGRYFTPSFSNLHSQFWPLFGLFLAAFWPLFGNHRYNSAQRRVMETTSTVDLSDYDGRREWC